MKCYLNLKKCLLPCFCSVNFGKNHAYFMNAMKQNIFEKYMYFAVTVFCPQSSHHRVASLDF